MTKLNSGLWLTAAVALALTVGCGDLTGSDGGTGGCTSDTSCSAGDMCHPVLKSCVPTCTGSGDCPSSAKTCATITGAAFDADAGVKAFCQCSTSALCNGGSTGNLVCQTASSTCQAKCTSNSNCPSGGYTCDTATGDCTKSAGTDAGTDAGMPVSCAGTAWDMCPTGEVCNFATNNCQAAAACSTANAQPDTCGFAGYCSGSTCTQVSKPTCSNFSPPGGKTPVFDPRTSATPAPIIWSYVDEATDDTAFCGTSGLNTFTITLRAYRDDADWPAQAAALPGFFYVKVDGSEASAIANMRPSGYQHTGKTATFKLTFCSATVTSNLSAGFYFTNGNEFCALAATGTVVP